MKKILGALIIAAAFIGAGCGGGGNNGGDSVNRSGAGRGGGQAGPNSNNGQPKAGQASPATVNQNPGMWGTIVPQTSTSQYPVSYMGQALTQLPNNDVTRAFLSTNLQSYLVGGTTQSPDIDYPQLPTCFLPGVHCQIVMAMPLTIQSQSLSAAMNSNTIVPITQGSITIVVYDSLVGTLASDGTTITPFPIYLNLASSGSFIQKNQFIAVFADQLGMIAFTGSINNGATTGVVDFVNLDSVQNSGQGASGRLGNFQMNTCSIFTQQCF